MRGESHRKVGRVTLSIQTRQLTSEAWEEEGEPQVGDFTTSRASAYLRAAQGVTSLGCVF